MASAFQLIVPFLWSHWQLNMYCTNIVATHNLKLPGSLVLAGVGAMLLDCGSGPFPVSDPGITEGPASSSLLLCRGVCARKEEQQWWHIWRGPHTRTGGSCAILARGCRGNSDFGHIGALCSNRRGSRGPLPLLLKRGVSFTKTFTVKLMNRLIVIA